MIASPSGPTGASCLSPPKRLPSPAARTTRGTTRAKLLRGERGDRLTVERVEVAGLAAGHEVAVDADLLVDPVAARVADVGLQARPRREGPSSNDVGLHERPRRVADGRNRLAGLEEAADEVHRLLLHAQLIGVGHAAG